MSSSAHVQTYTSHQCDLFNKPVSEKSNPRREQARCASILAGGSERGPVSLAKGLLSQQVGTQGQIVLDVCLGEEMCEHGVMKLPCIISASLAQPSAVNCLGICWASIPVAQGQQPLIHVPALIVSVAAGVLDIDTISADTAASTKAHSCIGPSAPLSQLASRFLAAPLSTSSQLASLKHIPRHLRKRADC